MATNTIAPRAFAVWWKDLHRWGVKSFQFSQWRWPPPAIKKLATALERRFEIVDKTSFELRPEHFLSLRFTGEVEPRDLHGKSEFKGSLFFAHAGDIIYSKIDETALSVSCLLRFLSPPLPASFPSIASRRMWPCPNTSNLSSAPNIFVES